MDYDKAYQKHFPYLKVLANKYKLNGLDYEDTLQEYSLVMLNVCDKYNDKYAFTTILDKACLNYMLTFNGKNKEFVQSLDFIVYNNDNGENVSKLDLIGDDTYASDDLSMLDKLMEIKEKLLLLPRGDITLKLYLDNKYQKEIAKEYEISQVRVSQINEWNIGKVRDMLCV